MKIRVLSYNIHKGFGLGNEMALARIRAAIRATRADLACLQEIVGEHSEHPKNYPEYPTEGQFEYLADTVWTHYSYGKNAVYPEGHHGNAILSKFPILETTNTDVSHRGFRGRFERRGILYCKLDLMPHHVPLHAFSVHLGLFETDRRMQQEAIAELVTEKAGPGEPVIIAGDFNDWGKRADDVFNGIQMTEAFLKIHGRHARTFPAAFPSLSLDRIYFRNLNVVEAVKLWDEPWPTLSDHLPLMAGFLV